MDKAGAIHTAKRRHMLRRFAKARKYADALAEGAAARGNARCAAEARLYRDAAEALELWEKVR
jgi:Ribonuclease G/E